MVPTSSLAACGFRFKRVGNLIWSHHYFVKVGRWMFRKCHRLPDPGLCNFIGTVRHLRVSSAKCSCAHKPTAVLHDTMWRMLPGTPWIHCLFSSTLQPRLTSLLELLIKYDVKMLIKYDVVLSNCTGDEDGERAVDPEPHQDDDILYLVTLIEASTYSWTGICNVPFTTSKSKRRRFDVFNVENSSLNAFLQHPGQQRLED
ncbi:hypothetical protein STEG23_024575 [Scotinomys teguina]